MSARFLTFFRRAPVALGVLTFTLTAATVAWESPVRPADPAPVFTTLETAANPVTLQLLPDGTQVVGWISGSHELAGRTVTVTLGKKTEKCLVGKDNTFTWKYRVTAPATAEFAVEDGPRGSVVLEPPPAPPGPCVFFVVDRTAYRPGQVLNFAGFLRKQDAAGEFVPLAGQTVAVELTSSRKGTRAAKLKLTADEQGRIVGRYTFSDADALDQYTLAIPGYRGGAAVLLGEYRKSKVRLKISGCAQDGKMKLTFEALDFLDKPVPISHASFVAQVIRRAKEKNFTLKAEDFVYHESRPFPLGDLDSLSEEDLLFWEAEGISAQNFPGLGNIPLTQLQGDLVPKGDRPAEYVLDLQPEWLRGDCAVVVQGVITDANGREQRASTTLPIEEKKAGRPSKKALDLVLAKKRYFTREPIEVRAEGARGNGTLVVMKLAFQTPSAPISWSGSSILPHVGRLPSYYRGRVPLNAVPASNTETVRRQLVTAVPLREGTAKVALSQPGAYKLIAVVPREDGTSLQEETTVVVKRPDDTNALVLRLDREEYRTGERLTGVVHCRFAGARALLTLRDSTGIRLVRPITFRGGICRLDEPLPDGLRYGCSVEVAYPEEDVVHAAHTFARVVPADRMLTVEVKTPGTVQPGETVNLELRVNRSEPIDLVVSVYDQSLLGIAADRSVDVRNFFLADERVSARLDRTLLQQRLGSIRIGTLLKRAQALLEEAERPGSKTTLSHVEQTALKAVLARRSSRYVYSIDVATLLRLAGVDVYLAPFRYGTNWYQHYAADESNRLIDLVKAAHGGWRLMPRFVGNTLLLAEVHPSHVGREQFWHPVLGWNYQYPYSGYPYLGQYALYNSRNYYGAGGFNNLALSQGQFSQLVVRGRGAARGDAARSWSENGPGLASANSMHSFLPEAQGFLSHLPGPGGAMLLDADGDQSHISVRRDFSDSAFWNAAVRTDASGKANVSFKLPDSLTNWQVVVTAVSPRMHVGTTKSSFRTYKPVMVWPMLPRTFTEGDRVEVFASVHNRTDEPQRIHVRLKVENGQVTTPLERTIEVGPRANAPVYWSFRPGKAGFTQLLMTADCLAGTDASLKRLPVVRAAAEQVVTVSGTVRGSTTFEVPEEADLASSRLEVTFAPSLAADLADTLNFLVEYPYGCVEQTMSRFLPAIKVAQILRQFQVHHPELEKKLPGCVAGGIKRLLELQQADGGWAWHGNGSTHEMMTPYALYGLLQAEKAGYQIPNESAVGRGLERLERFIQQMGDAQAADRVYCLYVFGHRRPIQPAWWKWVVDRAKKKALSDYALALALEMAEYQNQKTVARDLAEQLRSRAQKGNGKVWWRTAGFSRWGEDTFEITAAALKALVAHDRDDPLIDGVLGFFAATKRGNRWNSTKDTAMILYALCDYLARTEYSPQAGKTLSVSVNGGAAHTVQFADQLTRKVVLPGARLVKGKNTLTFRTRMAGVLYRAVFRYWKSGRDIAPMDRGLTVKRTFYLVDGKGNEVRALASGDAVPRGSYLLSVVQASQPLPASMRYVLVENPRPSGGETVPADDPRFSVQHRRCTPHVLREDREAMTVFHLEETPQSLVVRHVFLAELAGEYVIPPARVERMYQTETCGHSGSFVLRVTEK